MAAATTEVSGAGDGGRGPSVLPAALVPSGEATAGIAQACGFIHAMHVPPPDCCAQRIASTLVYSGQLGCLAPTTSGVNP